MPIKPVTVHLPESMLHDLEQLVLKKRFPNRSEAIRNAVRDFIILEKKANGTIMEE
ncbi:MAG: ribbon-helix-helix domain-containing protein [Candidatus Hodarchaeota archaeon]